MIFTSDWFSDKVVLLEKNLKHLKDTPVTGLEIGSYEGRSTIWFTEYILTHPKSKIISIDPYILEDSTTPMKDKTYFNFLNNVSKCVAPQKVKQFNCFSSEILPSLTKNSLDFAFIDGSHVSYDVLTDAVLTFPLMKKGGLMIFDDFAYGRTETGIAISHFMDCFKPKLKILESGYILIAEVL